MPGKLVTDLNLVNQLEGGSTGGRVVTDPALIAQLEGNVNSSHGAPASWSDPGEPMMFADTPEGQARAEEQGRWDREQRIANMGSSTIPTGPLGRLLRSGAEGYSTGVAGLANMPGKALTAIGQTAQGLGSDHVGPTITRVGQAITPDESALSNPDNNPPGMVAQAGNLAGRVAGTIVNLGGASKALAGAGSVLGPTTMEEAQTAAATVQKAIPWIFATQGATNTMDDAYAKGAGPGRALLAGSIAGAKDFLVGKAMGLDVPAGVTDPLAIAALKTGGMSALLGTSQVVQNASDKAIYDPTRKIMEGVPGAAAEGLAFGAMALPGDLAKGGMRKAMFEHPGGPDGWATDVAHAQSQTATAFAAGNMDAGEYQKVMDFAERAAAEYDRTMKSGAWKYPQPSPDTSAAPSSTMLPATVQGLVPPTPPAAPPESSQPGALGLAQPPASLPLVAKGTLPGATALPRPGPYSETQVLQHQLGAAQADLARFPHVEAKQALVDQIQGRLDALQSVAPARPAVPAPMPLPQATKELQVAQADLAMLPYDPARQAQVKQLEEEHQVQPLPQIPEEVAPTAGIQPGPEQLRGLVQRLEPRTHQLPDRFGMDRPEGAPYLQGAGLVPLDNLVNLASGQPPLLQSNATLRRPGQVPPSEVPNAVQKPSPGALGEFPGRPEEAGGQDGGGVRPSQQGLETPGESNTETQGEAANPAQAVEPVPVVKDFLTTPAAPPSAETVAVPSVTPDAVPTPEPITIRIRGKGSFTLADPAHVQRYQDAVAEDLANVDALKKQAMTSAERAKAILESKTRLANVKNELWDAAQPEAEPVPPLPAAQVETPQPETSPSADQAEAPLVAQTNDEPGVQPSAFKPGDQVEFAWVNGRTAHGIVRSVDADGKPFVYSPDAGVGGRLMTLDPEKLKTVSGPKIEDPTLWTKGKMVEGPDGTSYEIKTRTEAGTLRLEPFDGGKARAGTAEKLIRDGFRMREDAATEVPDHIGESTEMIEPKRADTTEDGGRQFTVGGEPFRIPPSRPDLIKRYDAAVATRDQREGANTAERVPSTKAREGLHKKNHTDFSVERRAIADDLERNAEEEKAQAEIDARTNTIKPLNESLGLKTTFGKPLTSADSKYMTDGFLLAKRSAVSDTVSGKNVAEGSKAKEETLDKLFDNISPKAKIPLTPKGWFSDSGKVMEKDSKAVFLTPSGEPLYINASRAIWLTRHAKVDKWTATDEPEGNQHIVAWKGSVPVGITMPIHFPKGNNPINLDLLNGNQAARPGAKTPEGLKPNRKGEAGALDIGDMSEGVQDAFSWIRKKFGFQSRANMEEEPSIEELKSAMYEANKKGTELVDLSEVDLDKKVNAALAQFYLNTAGAGYNDNGIPLTGAPLSGTKPVEIPKRDMTYLEQKAGLLISPSSIMERGVGSVVDPLFRKGHSPMGDIVLSEIEKADLKNRNRQFGNVLNAGVMSGLPIIKACLGKLCREALGLEGQLKAQHDLAGPLLKLRTLMKNRAEAVSERRNITDPTGTFDYSRLDAKIEKINEKIKDAMEAAKTVTKGAARIKEYDETMEQYEKVMEQAQLALRRCASESRDVRSFLAGWYGTDAIPDWLKPMLAPDEMARGIMARKFSIARRNDLVGVGAPVREEGRLHLPVSRILPKRFKIPGGGLPKGYDSPQVDPDSVRFAHAKAEAFPWVPSLVESMDSYAGQFAKVMSGRRLAARWTEALKEIDAKGFTLLSTETRDLLDTYLHGKGNIPVLDALRNYLYFNKIAFNLGVGVAHTAKALLIPLETGIHAATGVKDFAQSMFGNSEESKLMDAARSSFLGGKDVSGIVQAMSNVPIDQMGSFGKKAFRFLGHFPVAQTEFMERATTFFASYEKAVSANKDPDEALREAVGNAMAISFMGVDRARAFRGSIGQTAFPFQQTTAKLFEIKLSKKYFEIARALRDAKNKNWKGAWSHFLTGFAYLAMLAVVSIVSMQVIGTDWSKFVDEDPQYIKALKSLLGLHASVAAKHAFGSLLPQGESALENIDKYGLRMGLGLEAMPIMLPRLLDNPTDPKFGSTPNERYWRQIFRLQLDDVAEKQEEKRNKNVEPRQKKNRDKWERRHPGLAPLVP